MQLNRPKQTNISQTNTSESPQPCNVEHLINQLVDEYRPRMTQRKINLETDFDTFDACVDPSLLHSAAAALVENAIEAMPNGGEISITLIDGKYQWELEVADSFGMAFNSFEQESQESDNSLPVVIPFPETERLRNAHRAAMAQGGQIQTWSCPQGGTAHVLVIPRQRVNSNPQQPDHQPDNRGPDNQETV
jgi:K+-sensing histidine kinase KdpD